uniref:DNA-directed RNA polymerase n=1 Tax=Sphondylothamnion multifidum TaxID=193186 RepID=A0A4D6WXZ5_9FLOR|nr:RNA polymerase b'-subunit [Sphondylothamnion multifidum]
MNKNILQIPYLNKVIDKSELKYLITWAFRNYGIARASNMVDKLKDLGFYYATQAGISLSLEDLRIPPLKQSLLDNTISTISDTDNRYKRGEITAVERFQKVIDTWNYASESLKKQVVQYFKNTDPLNSIYMMAFSGARANISQVRQLVGMRGLMADPQGQIIDLPIANNFREGLTITDYFISSYGARKGLVDTALRTADSGYLTRRLVDVAQDVIIREYDCKTFKGILISEMVENQKILIPLKQVLLGRVLLEDIWDLDSNVLIAKANQSIDTILLEKLCILGLTNVLVRSPLTCSSNRSVCQLCYGWNLAHGRMVDLGEAVGIIAAQSIGEPGTQLTMRTFHTGGVFTGELDQVILSPSDGILKYSNNIILMNTRNKHGDESLLVNNDSYIKVIDSSNQEYTIYIVKGSLLLISNLAKVTKGQALVQYPINNRLIKEKAQKNIIADFSGSIHMDKFISDIESKKNSSINQNMIIWVLSGQVYNIPNDTNLMVTNSQVIQKNSLIARTKLVSKYKGLVHLIKDSNKQLSQKILLISSSKSFENCKVLIDDNQDYKNYILEIANKDKFILKNFFNKSINNNQIIADLVSNAYRTKTGGIIKYLDLVIVKNKSEENEKSVYDVNGSGYILWISEETHLINKDTSLLLVQHGQFIEAGTEIIQNVFANNSGILEVIEKDNIVREIIIKPGTIYELNDKINDNINKNIGKNRGFLRPGETILESIKVDKLVYWEHISVNDKNFILIRPVTVYAVPHKSLEFVISSDSFETDMINLKLIRKTSFRDGERVKSVEGINLITSHLVVKLSNKAFDLKCSMQIEYSNYHEHYYNLKFITADLLSLKDSYFINNDDLYTQTNILVQDKEFVNKDTVIAQTDIFSAISGQVEYIQNTNTVNRRILIISESNTIKFMIDNMNSLKVSVDDWIYVGDIIADNIFSSESGRVIEIQNNIVTIRIGQPYLISSGSFLHVDIFSLVQRGENIATLIYERSKTGDIVQGLPRIEEILEARKKTDSSFNPHLILEAKFRFYLNKGLTLYDSTRQSFLDIQLFLVKEIQLVYQSQGVDIADKHIEVIIRQMTSKVKIENGGDTNYLPGEIVELKKVESVNRSLILMNKVSASYCPILLGITKASLNTESFISAASFQETTKILTEAAISGKLDWLRGLKENVIIGRLIPAGTGFNIYNNAKINTKDSILVNYNLQNSHENLITKSNKNSSFEDIIVDDRSIRTYLP